MLLLRTAIYWKVLLGYKRVKQSGGGGLRRRTRMSFYMCSYVNKAQALLALPTADSCM